MNNFIAKLIALGIAYFSAIVPLVIVVLIFIFIDFITGMYASYKRKEPVISSKLKKTIEKFAFYSIAILCAHMFQIEMMPWIALTNIVAGFIALVELLSIYENIRSITGLDLVKQVKDYILRNLFKLKNPDQDNK